MIHSQAEEILHSMGKWLAVNGEAVYGTRPWKVYGEGGALYAIALATPADGVVHVKSLASSSQYVQQKIADVRRVRSSEKVTWDQTDSELTIHSVEHEASQDPVAFRISWR